MEQRRCTLKAKWLLGTVFICILGSTVWAQKPKHNPYADPRTKEPGFNLKNDATPNYDGKEYPYYSDMFDGAGLKPQEAGTYQQFPKDSVPVKLVLGKIVQVYDPYAEAEFVYHEYGIKLMSLENLLPADAIIVAVKHKAFVDGGWNLIKTLLKDEKGFVADLKNSVSRQEIPNNITLWSL